jgi:NTE family protein
MAGKTKTSAKKAIAVALQGGGAHGAFTWGVLDRLLEDERIAIEGVSATSAGAMNAAVLASGMLQGGADGARKSLEQFWEGVAKAADWYSPFRQLPGASSFSLEHSPMYMMADAMLRVFSPYQFNPLNTNPLRALLAKHVDFDALRKDCPIHLYLCATNVETGKIRIFSPSEISVEAVLASACLPMLFQAVEIDGQHYWDGGYVGNPAIYPLIYNCETSDVVIVHINPIERPGVPTSATDILNRINEISFNSSLLRELRAINFVTSLIKKGKVARGDMKEMLMHSIRSDETMAALGVSSKMNADWKFLCFLRDKGRAEADSWLQKNFDHIGQRSSIDVDAEFL